MYHAHASSSCAVISHLHPDLALLHDPAGFLQSRPPQSTQGSSASLLLVCRDVQPRPGYPYASDTGPTQVQCNEAAAAAEGAPVIDTTAVTKAYEGPCLQARCPRTACKCCAVVIVMVTGRAVRQRVVCSGVTSTGACVCVCVCALDFVAAVCLWLAQLLVCVTATAMYKVCVALTTMRNPSPQWLLSLKRQRVGAS